MLDLFDIVVTRLFAEAKASQRKARLRRLRDLDTTALAMRDACRALMADELPDAEVRSAAFAAVPRDQLAAAMAEIDALAPPEDHSIAELRERTGACTASCPR